MLQRFPYNLNPFGSVMQGRNWIDVNRKYRYGFNGKEKDFETANDNYDFGARIYDGRLGRWLSLDPELKLFVDLSPYSSFGNCPILFIDIEGRILIISGSNGDYIYENGKLFKTTKDGNNWIKGAELSEDELNQDKYASTVLGQIAQLNLTSTGAKLVKDLWKNKTKKTLIRKLGIGPNSVNGCKFDSELDADLNTIYFDPYTFVPLPIDGKIVYDDPIYFVLGHEMEHARSFNVLSKTYSVWYYADKEEVLSSEKIATHIENKIRSEAGSKLRTHYGTKISDVDLDENGEFDDEIPDEQSRILTSDGKSMFYRNPKLVGGKLKEGSGMPFAEKVESDNYDYASNNKPR